MAIPSQSPSTAISRTRPSSLPTAVLYSFYSASTSSFLPNTSYNHFARAIRKTPSSIVHNACLLARYLAVDVLLLLSACIAGMYLPTRCLAMGIHVTLCYIRSDSRESRSFLDTKDSTPVRDVLHNLRSCSRR
jgi:hypothetical protein